MLVARVSPQCYPYLNQILCHHRNPKSINLPFNHSLCIPNGRIGFSYHGSVLSIQITACQWAPCVANDDAIGIEHGHELEDELVTELLCHIRVTGDEIHKALHHPWRRSLARVHTCCYNNRLLLLQNKFEIITSMIVKSEFVSCIPFAFPLRVSSVQLQWDNRHYFLLTTCTRDAICRISILRDVVVYSLGNPANRSTCRDSCAQNRRYRSRAGTQRWMLTCMRIYLHCHRHRSHRWALDDSCECWKGWYPRCESMQCSPRIASIPRYCWPHLSSSTSMDAFLLYTDYLV